MSRDLYQGTRGEDVKILQKFLNFHLAGVTTPPIVQPGDLPLVPDGDFGPRTDRVVRSFQQLNGLLSPRTGKPDGIVGPITRRYVLDIRLLSSFGMLVPPGSGLNLFGRLQLTPPSLLSPPPPFPNLRPSFLSQLGGPGFGAPPSPFSSGASTAPAPAPLRPPQIFTLKLQSGLQSFSKSDPIVPWAFSVSTVIPVPHNRLGITIPTGVTLYENPLTSQLLGGKATVGLSVAPADWFSLGVQTALSQSLGPLDPHFQVSLTASLNLPMPFLWNLVGAKTSLFLGPSLTVLDIDPLKGVVNGPKKAGSGTITAGGTVTLFF